MDIAKEIAVRAADIEQRIQMYLPKAEGYQHTIFEAMDYSVTAGGKRLRPFLPYIYISLTRLRNFIRNLLFRSRLSVCCIFHCSFCSICHIFLFIGFFCCFFYF